MFVIFLTIRNEAPYIDEWIQYHMGIGVDKFVVLDDESSDGTDEVLRPYVQRGIVELSREELGPVAKVHRLKHYERLKETYHGWYMFYIDVDEFLLLPNHRSLEDIAIDGNITGFAILEHELLTTTTMKNGLYTIENEWCSSGYMFQPPLTRNAYKSCIRIDKSQIPVYIDEHSVGFGDGFTSYMTSGSSMDDATEAMSNVIQYCLLAQRSPEEEARKHVKYRRSNCMPFGYRADGFKQACTAKKLGGIMSSGPRIYKDFFNKQGYILIRNMFSGEDINGVLCEAKDIYITQMSRLGYSTPRGWQYDEEFNHNMYRLFKEHPDTFISCGKQCQHIINLWRLQLHERLIRYLKLFGLETPVISTRPVLFSNSKHCAKVPMNHTVPAHQDWASMQGSINSMVAWIPLVDIDQELGSIKVIPGSHRRGLQSEHKSGSFGLVHGYNEDDFVSFDMKQGDIILFNSFLVHKSGDNTTDNIRWSCHMRYNDLAEKSFIARGYPHAYIYKPIDEYLTPDFDTEKEIGEYLAK